MKTSNVTIDPRDKGTGLRKALFAAVTASALLATPMFAAAPATAGDVGLTIAGFSTTVSVKSMRSMRWSSVVKQERDFSCGAAAVATLLTYHYGEATPEIDVFEAMWANGDQQLIKSKGFSLLDMKNYLESRGYKADGFRVSLDKLIDVEVPAIVLISLKGYRHFVVIKGVTPHEVLVGDPARGIKRYSREAFDEVLVSDIVFLVRNKVQTAQSNFNLVADWGASPKAPFGDALSMGNLANVTFLLPRPNEF